MKHSLEFEQDFLAHLHDAMTPCCSCGWRGDCCNNQDDARIAWENHVDSQSAPSDAFRSDQPRALRPE